jgi:integrase
MARPRTGTIVRRKTTRGTAYSLRFHGLPLHRLGGDWEGWTEQRVQDERDHISRMISRGEYDAQTKPDLPEQEPAPTFRVAASLFFARKHPKADHDAGLTSTEDALWWALRHAVDKLGDTPVDEIDAHAIDTVTGALQRERAAIEKAGREGHPLTERITRKDGTTYTARRRGLSNTSINRVLGAVRCVLEDAQRYGHIAANPAADRRARVRQDPPQRTFLEIIQMEALLAGAAAAESEARGLCWDDVRAIRASRESNVALARRYRVSDVAIGKIRRRETWVRRPERNRNDVPRLVIVKTLLLSGLRVEELCLCDGASLDFASRRIKVGRHMTKTDAGVREIPMLPALYDALLEHKAEFGFGPEEPVFTTRTGRRQSTDNVRARVIATAHEHANELLAQGGLPAIGHVTPHTLRRAFASILAEIEVSGRRAMYLLGHVDPNFTQRVYQRLDQVSIDPLGRLPRLLGCTPDEAHDLFRGRGVLATNAQRTAEKARDAGLSELLTF